MRNKKIKILNFLLTFLIIFQYLPLNIKAEEQKDGLNPSSWKTKDFYEKVEFIGKNQFYPENACYTDANSVKKEDENKRLTYYNSPSKGWLGKINEIKEKERVIDKDKSKPEETDTFYSNLIDVLVNGNQYFQPNGKVIASDDKVYEVNSSEPTDEKLSRSRLNPTIRNSIRAYYAQMILKYAIYKNPFLSFGNTDIKDSDGNLKYRNLTEQFFKEPSGEIAKLKAAAFKGDSFYMDPNSYKDQSFMSGKDFQQMTPEEQEKVINANNSYQNAIFGGNEIENFLTQAPNLVLDKGLMLEYRQALYQTTMMLSYSPVGTTEAETEAAIKVAPDAVKKAWEEDRVFVNIGIAILDGLGFETKNIRDNLRKQDEMLSQFLNKVQSADSSNLNTQENDAVREMLADQDGIRDGNGFTNEYKGLFAWTAAFTPFKTNIFDGNIRETLSKEELELYKKYGANRSVLYRAKGDRGLLKNIANKYPATMQIMTLSDFLETAPTDEIALFIRSEDSKFINQESTEVGEITKVVKTMLDNQTRKDGAPTEEGKQPTEEVTNDGNIQREGVSDIGDRIGKFTVASDKDDISYIGPMYTSSGRFGKELETLDDANEAGFLRMNTFKTETKLEQAQSNLENLLKTTQGNTDCKAEIKAKYDAEWYDIIGNIESWVADITMKKDYDEIRCALDKVNEEKEKTKKDKESKVQSYNEDVKKDLLFSDVTMWGNQANVNYVLMYNSIKDSIGDRWTLEDDMDRPLYIDFLGNITTYSGIVVVPAAANANLYASIEVPMSTAMFINSYPEYSHDSQSGYKSALKMLKSKYIMSIVEGGIVRWYRPDIGDASLGNGDEIYTLPFISTVTDLANPEKKLKLIDYEKDFKIADPIVFPKEIGGQLTSKIYVNNGAVFRFLNQYGAQDINTKKISTAGGTADWQALSKINRAYIAENNPLNEIKIAYLASAVSKHQDQLRDIKIEGILSEDNILRNDKLVNFFGGIFEGVNNRFLSRMDKNFLMYTPTQDKLPVIPNAGVYTQRFIVFLILLAFVVLSLRFGLLVLRRQMALAKPLLASLLALCMIGGFVLYGFNPLIDLLFNKPADKLLENTTPMYILEMAENNYREQPAGFFQKDLKDQADNAGRPTLTLQKLTRKNAAYLRGQMIKDQTLMDRYFMPEFDQTEIKVQGNNIYSQGRDLKIDVEKLFNSISVRDVQTYTGVYLDVAIHDSAEYNNYMPYAQMVKTITNRVNNNSKTTYPPLNIIQYRRNFTKTNGRAESYFKSVAFIAPEKIEDLRNILQNEYKINLNELDKYTTPQLRTKMGIDLLSEELKNELSTGNIEKPITDQNGKVILTPEQVKMEEEKRKQLKNQHLLDEVAKYLNSYSEIESYDWLGLRYILMLEPDDAIVPPGTEEEVARAQWFPSVLFDSKGKPLDGKAAEEIQKRIKSINRKTKEFVLENIMPISGSVSDDTLIKVVALYAVMEYNKEFSTFGHKLYPTKINTEGLSNEFVTRSTMIPKEQVFVANMSQISKYIALKSGWLGLGMASIDRFAYSLRMIIKIALIAIIILTVPIIALWKYVVGKGDAKNKYIQGAMVSLFILSGAYIIEILAFKVMRYLTNNTNIFFALIINMMIQLALLTFYIIHVKNIIANIGSFGLDKIMDRIMFIRTGIEPDEEMYEMANSMVNYDSEYNYGTDYSNGSQETGGWGDDLGMYSDLTSYTGEESEYVNLNNIDGYEPDESGNITRDVEELEKIGNEDSVSGDYRIDEVVEDDSSIYEDISKGVEDARPKTNIGEYIAPDLTEEVSNKSTPEVTIDNISETGEEHQVSDGIEDRQQVSDGIEDRQQVSDGIEKTNFENDITQDEYDYLKDFNKTEDSTTPEQPKNEVTQEEIEKFLENYQDKDKK